MEPLAVGMLAVAAFAIGGTVGFLAAGRRERTRRDIEKAAAQDEASQILASSKQEAESLLKSLGLQGKEGLPSSRRAWEKEEARRREELERLERRAEERSSSLDSRHAYLDEREGTLERRSGDLGQRERLSSHVRARRPKPKTTRSGGWSPWPASSQQQARDLLIERPRRRGSGGGRQHPPVHSRRGAAHRRAGGSRDHRSRDSTRGRRANPRR